MCLTLFPLTTWGLKHTGNLFLLTDLARNADVRHRGTVVLTRPDHAGSRIGSGANGC